MYCIEQPELLGAEGEKWSCEGEEAGSEGEEGVWRGRGTNLSRH